MPPRLPFDLLYLMVQYVIDTASTPCERADARAVSLVCRNLRDVGQAPLWHNLTFPHLWAERGDEGADERRVLGMVRCLRWEEEEGRELQPERPRFRRSMGAFFSLFGNLTTITAVELVHFPHSQLPLAFSAISSSASISAISSLRLVATAHRQSHLPSITDADLVEFLQSLPALTSLDIDASFLPPAHPASPYSLATAKSGTCAPTPIPP
ncbi:hypothetical protein JCM8097_006272 [Rhodosporidiobolus ruineniae]